VPLYFIGQLVGAFLGGAIIFGIYYERLIAIDPEFTVESVNSTAAIFGTFPAPDLSIATVLYVSRRINFNTNLIFLSFDQLLGTFILVICVASSTDNKLWNFPAPVIPFFIGGSITAIGLSLGSNCGLVVQY